jgi:hypothetical protein
MHKNRDHTLLAMDILSRPVRISYTINYIVQGMSILKITQIVFDAKLYNAIW